MVPNITTLPFKATPFQRPVAASDLTMGDQTKTETRNVVSVLASLQRFESYGRNHFCLLHRGIHGKTMERASQLITMQPITIFVK